jgi:hypothetical protein
MLAVKNRTFDKSDVPHIDFTDTIRRLTIALQQARLLREPNVNESKSSRGSWHSWPRQSFFKFNLR